MGAANRAESRLDRVEVLAAKWASGLPRQGEDGSNPRQSRPRSPGERGYLA